MSASPRRRLPSTWNRTSARALDLKLAWRGLPTTTRAAADALRRILDERMMRSPIR